MIKNMGISLICTMLILSNVFVFTTLPTVSADDSDNTCPTAFNPTIANQSKDVDIDIGWFNITIEDADGNNTYGNITCWSGSYVNTVSWSNQPNGTRSMTLPTLQQHSNYTIYVNFTDGECNVNKTYWFWTEGKGSIYVVGSGTRRIYDYSKATLSYMQCSARCPGELYAVDYDDTYVYAGGGDLINKTKVFQFWRSNLTLKQNTTNYGGRINFVVVDDSYVYAGGAVTNKTYQYWKSNMTKKAETDDYGGIIFGIAIDDTYIYVGGRKTNCTYQYWKSNMTLKATTEEINGDIYYVDIDDTYVYAGGYRGITYQYWKSNMTYKANTTKYGGSIYSMANDDTYVYVGGLGSNVTRQYWKSNMSLKQSSASYGGAIWGLDDDDAYVYAGGETIYKVYQYWKTNLTKRAESSSYGNNIYRLIVTEDNTRPTITNPNPSNESTGISLTPTINATVTDIDGNNIVVDFYYSLSNSPYSWVHLNHQTGKLNESVSTTATFATEHTTKYWWMMTADDTHDNTTSAFWSFTTVANNPPFTPSDPNPVNHATSIDINANLNWLGSDPDCGDIVTYDIYFGTASNPPLHKSGHTSTIYDPGIMNYNTKYYWKIIAKDDHAVNTTGPIWDFTTVYVNQPPNTPYNPTPEDGIKSINIDQDLNWSGGDPDAGDTITYDVYFGYILPLQKVASNISTPTYNPGTLTNSLTYFWKIVAWDNHGLSTYGPRWYFTTINATNNPPNKPSKPSGITSGKIGTTHSYSSSTTDPNGDYVYYWFDWGDGTNSGWDGPHNSGDNVTLAHSWTRIGTYPIKVKVKDIYGNVSVWSDPLVISMPKTKISNLILQLLYRIFEYFPLLEKIIQRFPIFEKILNLYYN